MGLNPLGLHQLKKVSGSEPLVKCLFTKDNHDNLICQSLIPALHG